MKKIIGTAAIAAALLLGTVASADSVRTSGVTFGVSNLDIKDHSTGSKNETFSATEFKVGLDFTRVWSNNFLLASTVDVTYASPNLGLNGSTPIYGLGTDIKLGYQVLNPLSVYAVGGVSVQYIKYNEDPTIGYGFEYGVGTEYTINKSFAVNAEWKTSNQSAKGNWRDISYDYNTLGVNLKYIF
jgi:opacity protein-like surface antigen